MGLRKKVTPAQLATDEPYVTITRQTRFRWLIEYYAPSRNGYMYSNEYWYAHSESGAKNKAKRKLRIRKRRLDWKKTITRLDIER